MYVYSTFLNALNEERVCSEDEPRGDYGIQIKKDLRWSHIRASRAKKSFACVHMSNSYLGSW